MWLSGAALSPLLYDDSWGGVVSCGCYFDPSGARCMNRVSGADCPCLYDLGQNFGHGFFQDHHFHFGYFLYAAAVVARFQPSTAVRQYDRVLLLARDIANPSAEGDPWFPEWRHKDWCGKGLAPPASCALPSPFLFFKLSLYTYKSAARATPPFYTLALPSFFCQVPGVVVGVGHREARVGAGPARAQPGVGQRGHQRLRRPRPLGERNGGRL